MNVLVCIAIIIRLTVDLKMLLFRKIVYLMSVVIICFDVPKYLSCVLFASLIASAFTKELRTLVAFLTRRFVCVCVCAGGKISRLSVNHLGTFLA